MGGGSVPEVLVSLAGAAAALPLPAALPAESLLLMLMLLALPVLAGSASAGAPRLTVGRQPAALSPCLARSEALPLPLLAALMRALGVLLAKGLWNTPWLVVVLQLLLVLLLLLPRRGEERRARK